MQYVLILLFGYLIGSFPTAFLLVKKTAKYDIRSAGSGNVGAMNTYDVTRSKFLGIAVMAIDVAKGISAVLFSSLLFSNDFWMTGISGIGAVLGHNYSPWIRFKGGRGLATGAGVMFALAWIVVVLWCTAWGINYSYSKNIHISNVVACIATPLILWLTPEKILYTILPSSIDMTILRIVLTIILSLILIRHIEPFMTLFKSPQ